MRDSALNVRLCSAAQLVRQDAVFADIGTDHAYLPIFLLKSGKISRAVCSDINEGPLNKARENAEQYRVEDKIDFYLTDGAAALYGLGITDYAVCGMGGELISDIIAAAPQLKDEGVNLILQPMSRQAVLRKFLAKSGFSVKSEVYSLDGERSYVCLLACYTGECREISEAEAEIGFEAAEIINKDLQIRYLKGKLCAYKKAAEGKRLGGNSADAEEKMIEAISAYIKE